jgi:Holliday junction resolvase
VSNPQKEKGSRAERELAALLADQLGIPVRRKLGAGRLDDCGDIDGLPQTTIECKDYRDVLRAIREGVDDCVREQANAGTTFGVTFVRRPGGRWIAVQTIDQFCTMWREATG